MTEVKLTEICNPKQWKTLSTEQLLDKGYPVYGANGRIGYYSSYNHENPTIMITCRGATCGSINVSEPKSWINGNAMSLDNLSSEVDLNYLVYFLCHYNFKNVISGSAQPQITREGLEKVKVKLCAKDKQIKISEQLGTIKKLIHKQKQILLKYDILIKSRFIEMFGDPVENQYNWPESLLCNIADVVSGITKGRKTKETELFEVPYMAVSNVKAGYIDWTTVKSVYATKSEIQAYQLKINDVLMTEGGDPDKVGRGALLTSVPDNCIHQNHIFRVRFDESFNPLYFAEYLQHSKAKKYFFKCAKQTTGIASINMGQLKKLPVLIPPLELQQQFADFVQQIDKSKFEIWRYLKFSDIMNKIGFRFYD